MVKDLPKIYDPQKTEGRIYELWEKSGFFNPDKTRSQKTYCNILPPPNANGKLHLGHASGYTVMDIFGRYARMKGKKTLLLPGKDHAGIQTQVVYEKKIKDERNITCNDLGREKFYQEVFDFCRDRSNYMRSQEKKIGISADWSREKFTLDPKVLKIALETFVKMYEDGLVYKGNRIINWCPRCATALSDVEVIHKEEEGKLYFIKYPLKNSKYFITVATTRPETMLGDTAVAVNPKDERYKNLIGKIVTLPLQNREIPIIVDRHIEIQFGTGAVKITPAHDPLDWQIGKDHGLSEIQVINGKAEITNLGGKYQGQSVLEARENILKDLSKIGLLEKEEKSSINKLICERCKTAIEPLISEQWFINVDAKKYSLKKAALKSIQTGKIKIYPENFKKILIHWYENLNDWCISRQIWWGPRFPAWYKNEKIHVGIEKPKGKGWIQDTNTFDTWFTSSQWPYTTLGYPEGKDIKAFYPTDMMIMGIDILFFWSARMIMMGLYRTKKVPFKNLYFTGLIRDKEGSKMSKSHNNGIDPLEMIEKFGADALRLSFILDTASGQDSRLYEEKIESFRNYVNKLWNISRYCFSSSDKFSLREKLASRDFKIPADRWIVDNLDKLIQETNRLFDNKQISLAADKIKKFTWNIFADWYVEIHKIEKNDKILGYVLDKILKLSHPFTPFVTEEIFQLANSKNKKMLMLSHWPSISKNKTGKNVSEGKFETILEAIIQIRNIRSIYKIDSKKKLDLTIQSQDQAFFNENRSIFQKLARVDNVFIVKKIKRPRNSAEISFRGIKMHIHLENVIDVAKEQERLQKEILNAENYLDSIEKKLANKEFINRAPQEIIQREKNNFIKTKEKLCELKNYFENIAS